MTNIITTLPDLSSLAAEIRTDYAAFSTGMHSFLLMGLRLHEAKASIPHGHFMKWCKGEFADLSHTQLLNSMRVAEWVCLECEVEIRNALRICQDCSANPLFDLVDGKSHRQLLSAVHESRTDETEEKNRALCEARWEKQPTERDEWEPRVLSGELSYTLAWRGMLGAEDTKDQPRKPINFDALLTRNAVSYENAWKNWEVLPEETRLHGIAKLQEALSAAPAEVKKALRQAITA